jgi:hypothetical protein
VHLVGCFIENLKMHGTTNPKFRNNEMDGAGSTYGGDEKCIKDFGGKT